MSFSCYFLPSSPFPPWLSCSFSSFLIPLSCNSLHLHFTSFFLDLLTFFPPFFLPSFSLTLHYYKNKSLSVWLTAGSSNKSLITGDWGAVVQIQSQIISAESRSFGPGLIGYDPDINPCVTSFLCVWSRKWCQSTAMPPQQQLTLQLMVSINELLTCSCNLCQVRLHPPRSV